MSIIPIIQLFKRKVSQYISKNKIQKTLNYQIEEDRNRKQKEENPKMKDKSFMSIFILNQLNTPMTKQSLWEEVKKKNLTIYYMLRMRGLEGNLMTEMRC